METRIRSVEERLGLDRSKAREYIEQVEDDRQRLVKVFYNIDWTRAMEYDFVINVKHASVENVTSAFCPMAQLPEFQETPACRRVLQDLLLGSQCRLALARDDRTYFARFQVRADSGVVSVTYLPRHAKAASFIPQVLGGVAGVQRILCTMASTRILWVQEHFDASSQTCKNIQELASKWGAAVELVRLIAAEGPTIVERPEAEPSIVDAVYG
jgi:hypothetical protein